MVRQMLSNSRYFILVAVVGSFLSAVTIVIYGGITVVKIIYDTADEHDFGSEGIEHVTVDFIEVIDLFLLGMVLYIVALGLYELFINTDLEMPNWLIIRDLDELKAKLIGVIIVLLGVSFLGNVRTHVGGRDILYQGLGIAAVILALVAVIRLTERPHQSPDHEPAGDQSS